MSLEKGLTHVSFKPGTYVFCVFVIFQFSPNDLGAPNKRVFNVDQTRLLMALLPHNFDTSCTILGLRAAVVDEEFTLQKYKYGRPGHQRLYPMPSFPVVSAKCSVSLRPMS